MHDESHTPPLAPAIEADAANLPPPDPRAVREALGWTQGRMAEALGVSQTTVSRWEVRPETMKRLHRREYWRLAQAAPGESGEEPAEAAR